MTFIDWSDPEGMFGLFMEFVADERAECREDPDRHRFLSRLWAQLRTVESRIHETPSSLLIERLRGVHESAAREFDGDPVLVHLRDCIEELENVEGRG